MQDQIPEGALWAKIASGDEQSFDRLFGKHFAPLLIFGLTIRNDKALVKDIIQEVFLEIWDKRATLPTIQHPRAYLQQILKRKLLKRLRSDGLKPHQDMVSDSSPSYESLLIQQQEDQERQKQLERALNKLTNKQREMIQLRFFDGLSYEQIADKTDTQKRTVYNQIHRAIKSLKDTLLISLLLLLP
ncbi:MAG: sigma-70 family RNA polymerase sigma factor [Saprospiraceae bacterium]|nr:sigma-70 family RNA polymerase sigma factor [Saprospiraceae bacterium]